MRILLFVGLVISGVCPAQNKRVCITIDDLPCANCAEGTWDRVTDSLLAALEKHKVPAIGFLNENKLYRDGVLDSARYRMLVRWLDAGMDLGNHTFAHLGATRHSLAAYEQDILQGERHLRPLMERHARALRYFRHPFLQAGPTEGYRDSLNATITRLGYRIAPVTCDNDEYIHAYCYEFAKRTQDTDWLKWQAVNYVDYMAGSVRFQEEQAQAFFNRPIPHILLIHANTLNAELLDALLTWFEHEGYSFITLEEALKDECYTRPEATTRYGFSWIRRWQLAAGQQPPWPPEIDPIVQRRYDSLQRR